MGEIGERFDLDTVKMGLISTPKHVSDDLQWITNEGQKLFQERDKQAEFYRKDELALVLAMKNISDVLPQDLVIIDLGAGKTSKSAVMLRSLIQGHPQRRICYVPIDLSDCVHGWREFLQQEYPDVNKQVTGVFPMVKDMVESLGHIAGVLANTEYGQWEKLYCNFGPNTLFLHNDYWNRVVKAISQCICEEGHGFFAYSYVPWNDSTVTNITKSLYSQVNLPGIMYCILKGAYLQKIADSKAQRLKQALTIRDSDQIRKIQEQKGFNTMETPGNLNKLTDGNLDPESFEFKSEFITDIATEDGLGTWAGWAMYAEATRDVEASFKNLNLDLTIEKGERIRLSQDLVKSHYKTESYMTALASNTGLKVTGNWTEDSGLLASIVLQFDETKDSASVKLFTN